MSAGIEQRNQEATCYVGNLDERVNEELLWELMLQAGPVVSIHMPKDKVTGKCLGYGFAEFRTEEDADYAMKVLNMVKLHGRPIKVNKSAQDRRALEVGANIFIGNLDPDVDEKLLHDTFSAFGGIVQTPKIMCDPATGQSKGYAFISFDSFEASDMAIECMNGQYLCNRPIVVQYAFKKDTPGERHGSQAERMLAASQPNKLRPHTIFSAGQGDTTAVMPPAVNYVQPDYAYHQYPNPMMMYGYDVSMGGPGAAMMMSMGGPPMQSAPVPPLPHSMHMHMPPAYGIPPPPPPLPRQPGAPGMPPLPMTLPPPPPPPPLPM